MTALISFGRYNRNIIFPFLGGIISFVVNIILDKSKFSDYPIILCLCSSFGMSLSFIFVIIYNLKNKIKRKTISAKIQKEINENFIGRLKFVLLCALLDFIETFLIYKYCGDVKVSLWIFDIIFLSLFSYLIFQIKVYKHHYLSIFVIIITGVIIDIIVGYYNTFSKNIFIKLLSEFIISFDVGISKYTMDTKFLSPYEMTCYIGIFEFILYSLIFVLSKKIKYLEKFKVNFDDFELKDLGTCIIIVIMKLFYNLLNFVTVKNTSTCHFMIITIIGELATYFIGIYDKKYESYEIFIIIFGFLIIIFMTLIFNEIIELNFCGLAKNTKRNIYIRSRKDEKDNEDDNESQCSEDNYLFSMEMEEDFKLNLKDDSKDTISLESSNK